MYIFFLASKYFPTDTEPWKSLSPTLTWPTPTLNWDLPPTSVSTTPETPTSSIHSITPEVTTQLIVTNSTSTYSNLTVALYVGIASFLCVVTVLITMIIFIKKHNQIESLTEPMLPTESPDDNISKDLQL